MKLFNRKKQITTGFTYCAVEDDPRFRHAKIGDVIVNERRTPPWIVVDHETATIIVANWPGRLFEVEILDPSGEEDLNADLVKNVWYSRTLGVRILNELPIRKLFGPNGQHLCRIIDKARSLSVEQVESLTRFDTTEAGRIFAEVWNRWIATQDRPDGVVAFGMPASDGSFGSPINRGLSTIAPQVDVRARELLGDEAFIEDEDGETCLVPDWSHACSILLHAGLSHDPDGLLSAAEKRILSSAFREVFER
ncbi:MAG: hypothetical protein CMJ18_18465 [Phycisphaeraceae bacterium]|nr:hypothetical protein [Phycisphaeraceae bacterium]